MDNNPVSMPGVSPMPQQPVAPNPVVNMPPPEFPKQGSKKGPLIIIILLVLILAGGALLWFNGNQQKSAANPVTVSQVASPQPSASPAQTAESLQNDLNSSSLDDLDKQFSSVDTDLGSL